MIDTTPETFTKSDFFLAITDEKNVGLEGAIEIVYVLSTLRHKKVIEKNLSNGVEKVFVDGVFEKIEIHLTDDDTDITQGEYIEEVRVQSVDDTQTPVYQGRRRFVASITSKIT